MDSIQNLSLSDNKLIVGIDFGTTFSGLSWAETRRPDTFNVVDVGPASLGTNEGATEDKVSTELRYTLEGVEWGFQIPPMIERHQLFKLGLVHEQTTTPEEQMSPEQLASDYLEVLSPFELYLTAPAIWSELAKEKTLSACQGTGLNISASGIHLVSEPAAATHALAGLEPHSLNIGDSFVLCDAGGGTVDLIFYTITQLQPIRGVPGEQAEIDGWDEELMAEAVQRFDTVIKKKYLPSSTKQEGYTILLPGIADNASLGIRRGRMTMSLASRVARKHYGLDLLVSFEAGLHNNEKKFWGRTEKEYGVGAIEWFIKKGEAVEINRSKQLHFYRDFLVSRGRPRFINIAIWSDQHSAVAPMHSNSNVKRLANLKVNLAMISDQAMASTITKQPDGKDYYVINGVVEAIYESASTKYILLCEGRRYDTVTAEYV